MRRPLIVVLATVLASCSSGTKEEPPPQQASAPPATSEHAPATVADPTVSTELRMHLPLDSKCGAGDVCGFFLQVISPGSDAKDLADKAMKILKGKCGGHIIVYKDSRNVMGAGTVFDTEAEKHACEQALGRPADTDFPKSLVWHVSGK